MRNLWEDEQLKEICSWLVEATHRAWGARQGANGTEGQEETEDMKTDEHETRGRRARYAEKTAGRL